MTQQVVEFKSDTTVVTKQELSNTQSLANSTPSFEIFLPALTKKNVSLLKLYLDKEK
jgi:hypothetical protein